MRIETCWSRKLYGLEDRADVYYGIDNLLGTLAMWQSGSMDTSPTTIKYKNHRFPVEIISHAVWLYFRFCLSFRDVEELLLERGVVVTYETIRKWCRKFGQPYAKAFRQKNLSVYDLGLMV